MCDKRTLQGAYRDDDCKPVVLDVVREAESRIAGSNFMEYLPIGGMKAFSDLSVKLAFGEDALPIQEGRVAAVQSLSGTGRTSLAQDLKTASCVCAEKPSPVSGIQAFSEMSRWTLKRGAKSIEEGRTPAEQQSFWTSKAPVVHHGTLDEAVASWQQFSLIASAAALAFSGISAMDCFLVAVPGNWQASQSQIASATSIQELPSTTRHVWRRLLPAHGGVHAPLPAAGQDLDTQTHLVQPPQVRPRPHTRPLTLCRIRHTEPLHPELRQRRCLRRASVICKAHDVTAETSRGTAQPANRGCMDCSFCSQHCQRSSRLSASDLIFAGKVSWLAASGRTLRCSRSCTATTSPRPGA